MNKGLLVAIEGIDGVGKSSLIHPLGKILKANNLDVLITYEPGGTSLGSKLRPVLHEEKNNICDKAEYLLFAADRAQHFEEIVIPALTNGSIVISDRLSDSSVAYQGYGRKLDIDTIKKINEWAMCGYSPDIVFYLKLGFQAAIDRIMRRGGKLTSFETEEELFWQRVLNGYDSIFKDRKNVFILDANKPIDDLVKQASETLLKHLHDLK
jgi:dTMP kinase